MREMKESTRKMAKARWEKTDVSIGMNEFWARKNRRCLIGPDGKVVATYLLPLGRDKGEKR